MSKNQEFINKLRKQSFSLGTFVHMNGRGVIESIAQSGFDYIVIDGEHAPFSLESIEQIIDIAEANDITALVRITEISRQQILRTLDIGPKGLIIPYIETVEEVKQLVKHAKYSPIGQRGYCPTKTSNWGRKDWALNPNELMMTLNQEQLILPQCETLKAYQEIEAIVQCEGVDGIFVGPLDLSIALNSPFDLDSDIMKEAISKILETCKKYHKLAFIFASNIEKANEYKKMGFDSVAYSLDASIFMNACREAVALIKTK